MSRLLCLLGVHKWSRWQLHEAYGDREKRHCPICGKRQERKS